MFVYQLCLNVMFECLNFVMFECLSVGMFESWNVCITIYARVYDYVYATIGMTSQ